jgi:hypothetical protein
LPNDCIIASFRTPPSELIFDFDATDDRVHGRQEGAHVHGYTVDFVGMGVKRTPAAI